jgi:hypothetical protein
VGRESSSGREPERGRELNENIIFKEKHNLIYARN